jgi:hypothetical protein
MDNNEFAGAIPTQFGRLKSLKELRIYKNSFLTGSVPAEICNLVKDEDLSLLAADCAKNSQIKCDCCHQCY